MIEEYEFSFQNTKLLNKRSLDAFNGIKKIFDAHLTESYEQAVKAVNKMVYEKADETGTSIFDICFSFLPDVNIEYPTMKEWQDGITEIKTVMRLVPIKFEYEKGPGYWKGKYYKLKEKMQELLDSKEE